MLDRVGFDLDPVRGQVGTDRETLARAGFVPNRQLLFSPFQQLDARPLSEAFHEFTPGVRTLQSAIVSATAEAREPTISRIVLRLSGTEQARKRTISSRPPSRRLLPAGSSSWALSPDSRPVRRQDSRLGKSSYNGDLSGLRHFSFDDPHGHLLQEANEIAAV